MDGYKVIEMQRSLPPGERVSRIFEQLEKDRIKILRQEFSIGGQKRVFEKEECVFFVGDMRAILTKKGFRFEVHNHNQALP
jgi:hypothetical protein